MTTTAKMSESERHAEMDALTNEQKREALNDGNYYPQLLDPTDVDELVKAVDDRHGWDVENILAPEVA